MGSAKLLFLPLLILVFCLAPLQAMASGTLAPKLQAKLFKKVLSFDKELGNHAIIKLGVVYSAGTRQVATILVNEFAANGIAAEAVSMEELGEKTRNYDVLYLTEGTEASAATVQGSGLLRVSGLPDFANQGIVGIAVTEMKGKPRILIHQGCLSADGHEFSSKLLKLATVVG